MNKNGNCYPSYHNLGNCLSFFRTPSSFLFFFYSSFSVKNYMTVQVSSLIKLLCQETSFGWFHSFHHLKSYSLSHTIFFFLFLSLSPYLPGFFFHSQKSDTSIIKESIFLGVCNTKCFYTSHKSKNGIISTKIASNNCIDS